MKAPSIIGRRFGRLTVTDRVGNNPDCQSLWTCRCDCGNECVRLGGQLRLSERRGKRQSCGCWKNELAGARRRAAATHGLTTENYPYPKLYDVWRQMLRRCENPSCKDYRAYGARGISVCTAWRDPQAFVIWCVSSGYEEGLTIERKDVNGNYEPDNCTWVPNPLQGTNTRRVRLYSFGGYTMCVSEWARHLGVHVQTLLGRLRRGWPHDEVFTRGASTRAIDGAK